MNRNFIQNFTLYGYKFCGLPRFNYESPSVLTFLKLKITLFHFHNQTFSCDSCFVSSNTTTTLVRNSSLVFECVLLRNLFLEWNYYYVIYIYIWIIYRIVCMILCVTSQIRRNWVAYFHRFSLRACVKLILIIFSNLIFYKS